MNYLNKNLTMRKETAQNSSLSNLKNELDAIAAQHIKGGGKEKDKKDKKKDDERGGVPRPLGSEIYRISTL